MRKLIDQVKNFKQFVNETYKYSYYDKPKKSETFNPEYYLYTKLDGEGYGGDYSEFRNEDDYESYIENIKSTIDEIKSLKFPLRIYRGLNEKEVDLLKFHQHESGNISWTHNLNVANEFANGGIILTGVVNYDDVDIQATINRNVLHNVLHEDEIVLKDNKLIKDLKKFIKTTISEYLNENQIEQIRNIGVSINNKIEGGFLNKKQAEELKKDIESNYDTTPKFGQDSNDIRKSLYNYDNPYAEKDINGVNLRITQGLIEGEPYSGNRRKTWLLYADGKIVGKFYKVDDIKTVIKYIEDNLVKSITNNPKELGGKK